MSSFLLCENIVLGISIRSCVRVSLRRLLAIRRMLEMHFTLNSELLTVLHFFINFKTFKKKIEGGRGNMGVKILAWQYGRGNMGVVIWA